LDKLDVDVDKNSSDAQAENLKKDCDEGAGDSYSVGEAKVKWSKYD